VIADFRLSISDLRRRPLFLIRCPLLASEGGPTVGVGPGRLTTSRRQMFSIGNPQPRIINLKCDEGH
jgi:hypothetical protein